MSPKPSLRELLAFAHELADLARPIALAAFRAPLQVAHKDDRSPVTAADRGIERVLRQAIAERYPTHGIFGEEEGQERVDAEQVWVLDPIDGTKAFASGNPLFGTLIGLLDRGVPVLGICDAPALGERYAAARGGGATRNGQPLRARAERTLDEAVLYCTTPDPLRGVPGFAALQARVRWTSYGGDCLAYGFLAAGGCDLIVDRGLKPYDWCALVPILEAAGAVLCDWQQRALTLASNGDVVAASSAGLAAAACRALA